MRFFPYLVIISAFSGFIFPDEKPAVAILSFSSTVSNKNMEQTATAYVREEFVKSGRFNIVERDKIDAMVREQKLVLTGLTEEKYGFIGKLLSAERLVIGTLNRLDNAIVLSARVIIASNGTIENSAIVTLDAPADIEARSRELAQRLIYGRKMEVKYDHPFLLWGFAAAGTGLALGVCGFWADSTAQQSYYNAQLAYNSYTMATSNFSALWTSYQTLDNQARNYALARNILYISGLVVAAASVPLFLYRVQADNGPSIVLLPDRLTVSLAF